MVSKATIVSKTFARDTDAIKEQGKDLFKQEYYEDAIPIYMKGLKLCEAYIKE